jgi:hypothetical protein
MRNYKRNQANLSENGFKRPQNVPGDHGTQGGAGVVGVEIEL